ncbi:MAG: glycosyltransferase family 2 protein [Candidatus Omnitrophica bacterium]|nr:glycosyltransferase family 2 protein [Candidatus Omnitrophota bacterium]MDD5352669.1 glycosyltransferase family 2 protein [Candidatus Omnitrophota bacterium]MDD5550268.1 glycosyltransferase family 2 protein [Candidatus Omnitrophota bacterium]
MPENDMSAIHQKEIASLSVVIPTKNREECLLECLNSLFEQDYLPKEVIIVDQSSKDAEERIKSVIPHSINLIYVYDPKIDGATRARNIALKYVTGEFVLLLDDDVILLNNAIKNMLSIFAKDTKREIGGLGGFIVNEKPPFYFLLARMFFLGPFSFYNHQSIFQWKARKCDGLLQLSKLIPAGASCIRTEVLKEFKFDEIYSGYSYGEDSIFGYVVSSRYKLFLYSGLKFFHKRLNSPRDDSGRNIQMQIIWWFYFFNKYVKKSTYNYICYVWSIVGIILKVLIGFYDLRLLRGAVYGFRSIIRIILKRSTLENEIRNSFS